MMREKYVYGPYTAQQIGDAIEEYVRSPCNLGIVDLELIQINMAKYHPTDKLDLGQIEELLKETGVPDALLVEEFLEGNK